MADDFYKYFDAFSDMLLEQEIAASSAPVGGQQPPQQEEQASPTQDAPENKPAARTKDPLAGMIGQTIAKATFKPTSTGFVFQLQGKSGVPATLKLEGTRVTLVDFAGNLFPLN